VSAHRVQIVVTGLCAGLAIKPDHVGGQRKVRRESSKHIRVGAIMHMPKPQANLAHRVVVGVDRYVKRNRRRRRCLGATRGRKASGGDNMGICIARTKASAAALAAAVTDDVPGVAPNRPRIEQRDRFRRDTSINGDHLGDTVLGR
jgi:hypothetical protein